MRHRNIEGGKVQIYDHKENSTNTNRRRNVCHGISGYFLMGVSVMSFSSAPGRKARLGGLGE